MAQISQTDKREKLKKYPPGNCDCGDIFSIDNRMARVSITRELSGNVTKTKKSADRRKCNYDTFYYYPVGDKYIALCKRHARDIILTND